MVTHSIDVSFKGIESDVKPSNEKRKMFDSFEFFQDNAELFETARITQTTRS